eukprot:g3256.t1
MPLQTLEEPANVIFNAGAVSGRFGHWKFSKPVSMRKLVVSLWRRPYHFPEEEAVLVESIAAIKSRKDDTRPFHIVNPENFSQNTPQFDIMWPDSSCCILTFPGGVSSVHLCFQLFPMSKIFQKKKTGEIFMLRVADHGDSNINLMSRPIISRSKSAKRKAHGAHNMDVSSPAKKPNNDSEASAAMENFHFALDDISISDDFPVDDPYSDERVQMTLAHQVEMMEVLPPAGLAENLDEPEEFFFIECFS